MLDKLSPHPNKKGEPIFAGSVSDEAVHFRPTERLLDLRRGRAATQNKGFEISLHGNIYNNNIAVKKSLTLSVKRGKNANINLQISGDIEFAGLLAEGKTSSSIFTPGLSGISTREELRSRGALASSVMQGDANSYLRSLLYHLYDNVEDIEDYDEDIDWNEVPISELPDCKWKSFCILLDEVYNGARIRVEHNNDSDRYIDIEIEYDDQEMPLDLASTGMLQVIQILVYACYFSPPILLLDEPDAHLHADSQTKLFAALRGLTEATNTRIVLTSHSPQLIQQLHGEDYVNVCWIDEGAKVELNASNLPAIPLLMSIGALGLGSEAFDPKKNIILLTEDTNTQLVRVLAEANGADESLVIFSYNGCDNLPAAKQLAFLMRDLRPDAFVVIHRDRDFRTEIEMEFEKLKFVAECETNGIERVTEIFTTGNDVEHAFCSLSHFKKCYPEKNEDELEVIFSKVISENRDDFVVTLDAARKVIESKLYGTDRLKRNPAWTLAKMPKKCVQGKKLRPQKSTDAFPFEVCHGKSLEKALREEIRRKYKEKPDDIKGKMHKISDALKDPRWEGQFQNGI